MANFQNFWPSLGEKKGRNVHNDSWKDKRQVSQLSGWVASIFVYISKIDAQEKRGMKSNTEWNGEKRVKLERAWMDTGSPRARFPFHFFAKVCMSVCGRGSREHGGTRRQRETGKMRGDWERENSLTKGEKRREPSMRQPCFPTFLFPLNIDCHAWLNLGKSREGRGDEGGFSEGKEVRKALGVAKDGQSFYANMARMKYWYQFEFRKKILENQAINNLHRFFGWWCTKVVRWVWMTNRRDCEWYNKIKWNVKKCKWNSKHQVDVSSLRFYWSYWNPMMSLHPQ